MILLVSPTLTIIFCRGYLGPGGLHKNRTYQNCIGGATGYIDKLLLGSHNIYQYPTIYEVYEARPFDPEGVVGMSLKCCVNPKTK